jgi:hypothetical protein
MTKGEGGQETARTRQPLRLRLRRFLRDPGTIVGSIGAIALAGVLGATLPQRAADPQRWARWSEDWPRAMAWGSAMGLDHVYETWWFLGLVLFAAASLVLVIVEQVRRLPREWRRAPASGFGNAPYRSTFDRPARGAPSVSVRQSGRLGQLGSPMMHVGLAVLVVAGIARTLFATVAQVDLYVGETLGTRESDWGVQWPGRLARAIALPEPVVLSAYSPEVYASGQTRMLSATLQVGSSAEPVRVAVNQPAPVGAVAIYIDAKHGPAALLTIAQRGRVIRRAVLLTDLGEGATATEWLDDGIGLLLRAEPGVAQDLPRTVEVRAMRGAALLGVSRLGVGEHVAFPGGPSVALADVRWWSRFTGRRDASVPIAFAGIALSLAGVALNFAFVRLDLLVRVEATTSPGVERVTIAMRPRRFVPAFREDFAALVRSEGGPIDGC